MSKIVIGLDRLHWLWLVLAAPFLLFPSPIRSLALFVIPGLWIIAWLAGGQPLPRTPLNATLLLMFIMVLISLWVTFDIAVSLPALSGIVLGLGVYFAFVRLGQQPRGWWKGLLTFLIAVFGLAAVGLFGIQWIAKVGFLSPIISRIPPLLIGLPGVDEGLHPNEVAGGLLWGMGSWWFLALTLITRWKVARGRRWKITLSVAVAMIAIFVTGVFVLTQSRGGYIALALTLPVLLLFALPSKWRWYSLGILALLAIIMGILLAPRWDGIRTWFTGAGPTSSAALSLDTLQARLEIWSRAIYGIRDFPFSGIGMNTFQKMMPALYPMFSVPSGTLIPHAHNEFLQVSLDLGIAGLIAFLALYIGAFWMLFQVWRVRSSQEQSDVALLSHRWLALGLGSGLLAHMLYSLTDAIPLGSKYGLLFWMLLGLIAGLYQLVCTKKVNGLSE